MAPTKKKSHDKVSKSKQPRKLSANELMEAAEHALSVTDPRHAVILYTAALTKIISAAQKCEILERRAEVYVSLEQQDEALSDYQAALACVDLELHETSDVNSTTTTQTSSEQLEGLERKAVLYMYIGQLSTATDALTAYLAGIDCLKRVIVTRQEDPPQIMPIQSVHDGPKPIEKIRLQLATAYCTVAELYLTDLCFEEDAETLCESFLYQALQLDEHSLDALQAMCSLRLSQNRGVEAFPFVQRVFARMKTGCQALASLVGIRESPEVGATELQNLEEVQELPGFEFRCQTSKLLLECANIFIEPTQKEEQSQCTQAAVDVLGSLLAENDEVVEVWTLLGDVFAIGDVTQEQRELSCHYWERALDMLRSVQQSLLEEQQESETMEDEDATQEKLDFVVCQMEDLEIKLEKAQSVDETPMEVS